MTSSARVIGNRYELGELIGYGGMAEVHRGRDVRLGRDVAIKVLRADLARDQTFLNRFRREAQSAAGLNHPAIVAVYDTGEDGIGDSVVPYIVMEYVEGRTLRDILKTEGRLPARRAMEIVAEVCGALDFSHRNGIVHRDIKPANVMITTSGAVKVMDFGIARALSDNAATVTQTAAVIGTAQYLSPEQARGESVDARSDVYSTGCLLYELVTGHPPFTGDSPVAVAYQHVRETAATPSSVNPELPRALDSIVMKSLAKNPLNRYQSAAEMRLDLQRALADRPVEAEAVMTDDEKTQFISRVPLAPAAAGPVALRHDDNEAVEDAGRRSALIWTAVVVALLLVIAAGAYAIVALGKSDKPKTYAVPSVVGQKPDAARTALTSAGFTNIQDPTPSAGPCDGGAQVKEGYICTQVPAANLKVTKDTLIQLTVYKKPTVAVPGVVGLSVGPALDAITQAGLKPVQKPVNSSAPVNQVTRQDPEAGQPVAPGQTVTIYVSTGKLVLPDVRKLKIADAKTKLTAAGFAQVTVTQVPTTNKAQDGVVVDQSPPGGPTSTWTPDTAITLSVGQYQLPRCPTPTPSPSTSPGGSGSTSPGGSTTPTSPSSPPPTTPTGPPTCQP